MKEFKRYIFYKRYWKVQEKSKRYLLFFPIFRYKQIDKNKSLKDVID